MILEKYTKRPWFKFVALLLCLAVPLSESGPLAPDAEAASALPPITSPLSIDDISVPAGLGRIQESHRGSNGQLIVHIQDAHGSLSAQENMAKLVRHLHETYNINLLTVEGAAGELSMKKVRSFPDAEIRKEVAHEYLESFSLTGDEYYVIGDNPNLTVYGVERMLKYYFNREQFFRAKAVEKRLAPALKKLRVTVRNLENEVYNKRLRAFARRVREAEAHSGLFLDHIKYLIRLGGKGWENDHPELYAAVRHTKAEADVNRIISETKSLEARVRESLFISGHERRLYAASESLRLLEKVFTLSLTPDDYVHAGDLTAERVDMALDLSFLEAADGIRHDLPMWQKNVDVLAQSLGLFLSFYRHAKARDEELWKNTERAMEEKRSPAAMTISGGFHTPGLTDRWRKEGTSYLVIQPNMNAPSEKELTAYRVNALKAAREALSVSRIVVAERGFIPWRMRLGDEMFSAMETRRASRLRASGAWPEEKMAASRKHALAWRGKEAPHSGFGDQGVTTAIPDKMWLRAMKTRYLGAIREAKGGSTFRAVWRKWHAFIRQDDIPRKVPLFGNVRPLQTLYPAAILAGLIGLAGLLIGRLETLELFTQVQFMITSNLLMELALLGIASLAFRYVVKLVQFGRQGGWEEFPHQVHVFAPYPVVLDPLDLEKSAVVDGRYTYQIPYDRALRLIVENPALEKTESSFFLYAELLFHPPENRSGKLSFPVEARRFRARKERSFSTRLEHDGDVLVMDRKGDAILTSLAKLGPTQLRVTKSASGEDVLVIESTEPEHVLIEYVDTGFITGFGTETSGDENKVTAVLGTGEEFRHVAKFGPSEPLPVEAGFGSGPDADLPYEVEGDDSEQSVEETRLEKTQELERSVSTLQLGGELLLDMIKTYQDTVLSRLKMPSEIRIYLNRKFQAFWSDIHRLRALTLEVGMDKDVLAQLRKQADEIEKKLAGMPPYGTSAALIQPLHGRVTTRLIHTLSLSALQGMTPAALWKRLPVDAKAAVALLGALFVPMILFNKVIPFTTFFAAPALGIIFFHLLGFFWLKFFPQGHYLIRFLGQASGEYQDFEPIEGLRKILFTSGKQGPVLISVENVRAGGQSDFDNITAYVSRRIGTSDRFDDVTVIRMTLLQRIGLALMRLSNVRLWKFKPIRMTLMLSGIAAFMAANYIMMDTLDRSWLFLRETTFFERLVTRFQILEPAFISEYHSSGLFSDIFIALQNNFERLKQSLGFQATRGWGALSANAGTPMFRRFQIIVEGLNPFTFMGMLSLTMGIRWLYGRITRILRPDEVRSNLNRLTERGSALWRRGIFRWGIGLATSFVALSSIYWIPHASDFLRGKIALGALKIPYFRRDPGFTKSILSYIELKRLMSLRSPVFVDEVNALYIRHGGKAIPFSPFGLDGIYFSELRFNSIFEGHPEHRTELLVFLTQNIEFAVNGLEAFKWENVSVDVKDSWTAKQIVKAANRLAFVVAFYSDALSREPERALATLSGEVGSLLSDAVDAAVRRLGDPEYIFPDDADDAIRGVEAAFYELERKKESVRIKGGFGVLPADHEKKAVTTIEVTEEFRHVAKFERPGPPQGTGFGSEERHALPSPEDVRQAQIVYAQREANWLLEKLDPDRKIKVTFPETFDFLRLRWAQKFRNGFTVVAAFLGVVLTGAAGAMFLASVTFFASWFLGGLATVFVHWVSGQSAGHFRLWAGDVIFLNRAFFDRGRKDQKANIIFSIGDMLANKKSPTWLDSIETLYEFRMLERYRSEGWPDTFQGGKLNEAFTLLKVGELGPERFEALVKAVRRPVHPYGMDFGLAIFKLTRDDTSRGYRAIRRMLDGESFGSALSREGLVPKADTDLSTEGLLRSARLKIEILSRLAPDATFPRRNRVTRAVHDALEAFTQDRLTAVPYILERLDLVDEYWPIKKVTPLSRFLIESARKDLLASGAGNKEGLSGALGFGGLVIENEYTPDGERPLGTTLVRDSSDDEMHILRFLRPSHFRDSDGLFLLENNFNALRAINPGADPRYVPFVMSNVMRLQRIKETETVPAHYIKDPRGRTGGFIMPYLPGEGGRKIDLYGRRFTDRPAMTKQLIQSSAEAVAYVHERGYVHRDISPANFIVDADHDPVRVWLTDFELAVPVSSPHVPYALILTHTRGYAEADYDPIMDPPGTALESYDIFGWGATVYHWLTGEAPFPRAETYRYGRYPFAYWHPRWERKLGDSSWAPIVLGAMNLDRTARTPSMREIVEQIKAVPIDVSPRAGTGFGTTGEGKKENTGKFLPFREIVKRQRLRFAVEAGAIVAASRQATVRLGEARARASSVLGGRPPLKRKSPEDIAFEQFNALGRVRTLQKMLELASRYRSRLPAIDRILRNFYVSTTVNVVDIPTRMFQVAVDQATGAEFHYPVHFSIQDDTIYFPARLLDEATDKDIPSLTYWLLNSAGRNLRFQELIRSGKKITEEDVRKTFIIPYAISKEAMFNIGLLDEAEYAKWDSDMKDAFRWDVQTELQKEIEAQSEDIRKFAVKEEQIESPPASPDSRSAQDVYRSLEHAYARLAALHRIEGNGREVERAQTNQFKFVRLVQLHDIGHLPVEKQMEAVETRLRGQYMLGDDPAPANMFLAELESFLSGKPVDMPGVGFPRPLSQMGEETFRRWLLQSNFFTFRENVLQLLEAQLYLPETAASLSRYQALRHRVEELFGRYEKDLLGEGQEAYVFNLIGDRVRKALTPFLRRHSRHLRRAGRMMDQIFAGLAQEFHVPDSTPKPKPKTRGNLESLLDKLVFGSNLDREERAQLATLTLKDSRQAFFGVTPRNVRKMVRRRMELFKRVYLDFAQLKDIRFDVEEDRADMLWFVYLPWAMWIYDDAMRSSKRPRRGESKVYIHGINGPLGIGKAESVKILELILNIMLRPNGEAAAIQSIDDLYVSGAERERLRGEGIRLGPPGTHDMEKFEAYRAIMAQTQKNSVTSLPVFRKETGEVEEEGRKVRGKIRILLLHGWMLGANTDVHPDNVQGELARRVAAYLPAYKPLNDALDSLVVFNHPEKKESEQLLRQETERLRNRMEGAGAEWRGLRAREIPGLVRYLYDEVWDRGWKETSPVPPDKDVNFFIDTDKERNILSIRRGGRTPQHRKQTWKGQSGRNNDERAGRGFGAEADKPMPLSSDIDRVLFNENLDVSGVRTAVPHRRASGVSSMRVDMVEDLQAANGVGRTPLLESDAINAFVNTMLGRDIRVLFKDERQNPTGSFKDRAMAGLYYRADVERKPPEIVRVASTGNHALAALAAVRKIKERHPELSESLRVEITVPAGSAPSKLARIRELGGDVRTEHNGTPILSFREADQLVRREARDDHDRSMFIPHADPWVISGYSAMARETIRQLSSKNIDTNQFRDGELVAIAPEGSGGLLAGWMGLKVRIPHAMVYGVSAPPSDQAFRSHKAGRVLDDELTLGTVNILDATAVTPDAFAFDRIRELGSGSLRVSRDDALYGTALLEANGISVEAPSGLSIAALLLHSDLFRQAKVVVIPLTSANRSETASTQVEEIVERASGTPGLFKEYFESRRRQAAGFGSSEERGSFPAIPSYHGALAESLSRAFVVFETQERKRPAGFGTNETGRIQIEGPNGIIDWDEMGWPVTEEMRRMVSGLNSWDELSAEEAVRRIRTFFEKEKAGIEHYPFLTDEERGGFFWALEHVYDPDVDLTEVERLKLEYLLVLELSEFPVFHHSRGIYSTDPGMIDAGIIYMWRYLLVRLIVLSDKLELISGASDLSAVLHRSHASAIRTFLSTIPFLMKAGLVIGSIADNPKPGFERTLLDLARVQKDLAVTATEQLENWDAAAESGNPDFALSGIKGQLERLASAGPPGADQISEEARYRQWFTEKLFGFIEAVTPRSDEEEHAWAHPIDYLLERAQTADTVVFAPFTLMRMAELHGDAFPNTMRIQLDFLDRMGRAGFKDIKIVDQALELHALQLAYKSEEDRPSTTELAERMQRFFSEPKDTSIRTSLDLPPIDKEPLLLTHSLRLWTEVKQIVKEYALDISFTNEDEAGYSELSKWLENRAGKKKLVWGRTLLSGDRVLRISHIRTVDEPRSSMSLEPMLSYAGYVIGMSKGWGIHRSSAVPIAGRKTIYDFFHAPIEAEPELPSIRSQWQTAQLMFSTFGWNDLDAAIITSDLDSDEGDEPLPIDVTDDVLDGSPAGVGSPAGFGAAGMKELDRVMESALETYSNIHRGKGQYSQVSTALVDYAHDIALSYFGVDADAFTAIYGNERMLDDMAAPLRAAGVKVRKVLSRRLGLPLGLGVIVVRKTALMEHFPAADPPPNPGGGTVRLVTRDRVEWADAPDKFEPGTPNIIGIILLARALSLIKESGNSYMFKREEDTPSAEAARALFDESTLPEENGDALLDALKEMRVGRALAVPTVDGLEPYINFDNGASTPTFAPVLEAARAVLTGGVLRDTPAGRAIIKEVKKILSAFLYISSEYETLFTGSTSDASNILARSIAREAAEAEARGEKYVILGTELEHNSNHLPFRLIPGAEYLRLPMDAAGFFDMAELEKLLKKHNAAGSASGPIRLITVSAASNATGSINDLKEMARLARAYGARIAVDGAQLVAHRAVDISELDIDYFFFSAHKMYAPFGSGALIARKGLLRFSDRERRDLRRSGEDNLVGVAALGKAMQLLMRVGMDIIKQHEIDLLAYTIQKLGAVKGVTIYGAVKDSDLDRRTGVVSFTHDTWPRNEIAAWLALKGAIGSRDGEFCCAIAVSSVLKMGKDHASELIEMAPDIKRAGKLQPGLLRISFGLYNTREEVDAFISSLEELIAAKTPTELERKLAAQYAFISSDPYSDELGSAYAAFTGMSKAEVKIDYAKPRLSRALDTFLKPFVAEHVAYIFGSGFGEFKENGFGKRQRADVRGDEEGEPGRLLRPGTLVLSESLSDNSKKIMTARVTADDGRAYVLRYVDLNQLRDFQLRSRIENEAAVLKDLNPNGEKSGLPHMLSDMFHFERSGGQFFPKRSGRYMGFLIPFRKGRSADAVQFNAWYWRQRPELAWSFVKKSAELLRSVHQGGVSGKPVVHRDIKPANFLFRIEDEGIQMWLNDFEFSAPAGETISELDFLHGRTPRYSETEFVRHNLWPKFGAPTNGWADLLDASADIEYDIFSWGLALYSWVTGRTLEWDHWERDLSMIPDDSPYAAIIRKALEPSRVHRYRSMDAILKDIAAAGNPDARNVSNDTGLISDDETAGFGVSFSQESEFVFRNMIQRRFSEITAERWQELFDSLVVVDNGEQRGSGFVFEEDNDYYYVVTAGHALIPDEDFVGTVGLKKVDRPVRFGNNKVQLRFRYQRAQGEIVLARVSRTDNALSTSRSDVGIVRVKKNALVGPVKVPAKETTYARSTFPTSFDHDGRGKRNVIIAGVGFDRLMNDGLTTGRARRIPGSATLEIRAPIRGGFSGGPVIDEFGQVIGVAHSYERRRAYATDIIHVKQVLTRLLRDVNARDQRLSSGFGSPERPTVTQDGTISSAVFTKLRDHFHDHITAPFYARVRNIFVTTIEGTAWTRILFLNRLTYRQVDVENLTEEDMERNAPRNLFRIDRAFLQGKRKPRPWAASLPMSVLGTAAVMLLVYAYDALVQSGPSISLWNYGTIFAALGPAGAALLIVKLYRRYRANTEWYLDDVDRREQFFNEARRREIAANINSINDSIEFMDIVINQIVPPAEEGKRKRSASARILDVVMRYPKELLSGYPDALELYHAVGARDVRLDARRRIKTFDREVLKANDLVKERFEWLREKAEQFDDEETDSLANDLSSLRATLAGIERNAANFVRGMNISVLHTIMRLGITSDLLEELSRTKPPLFNFPSLIEHDNGTPSGGFGAIKDVQTYQVESRNRIADTEQREIIEKPVAAPVISLVHEGKAVRGTETMDRGRAALYRTLLVSGAKYRRWSEAAALKDEFPVGHSAEVRIVVLDEDAKAAEKTAERLRAAIGLRDHQVYGGRDLTGHPERNIDPEGWLLNGEIIAFARPQDIPPRFRTNVIERNQAWVDFMIYLAVSKMVGRAA